MIEGENWKVNHVFVIDDCDYLGCDCDYWGLHMKVSAGWKRIHCWQVLGSRLFQPKLRWSRWFLPHAKLISLRLYFPSPYLHPKAVPRLGTAQILLIYSPTAAFVLTLATLATLCKAFPCQKRSFLCSPPNPPASLPAALQRLWLPSLPKIGNAATEAMPDVKHISPDRKATCAVKAVGLAQDDPTLMVLNRYFSKITDIELGTWKGQMSMEAEIGQKPLRYPLWLDWSNSRAKWTESCQRSEWLCLQVMAREHMCLM